MSTYKLISNIEAEDKILGPLTLRQFLFAIGTVFLAYLNFLWVVKHLYFLLVPFVPPMLLVGFFAFPFVGDQPTEVWALARIRFLFKPRKRMWDQSGVKELVTITAPKKVERVYTDGLSQTEVQSKLKALAKTIDSRGWATKNVNIDNYTPNPISKLSSDRLVDIASVPDAVPETIVQARDDMLDEQHNPIAQQFNTMIEQSTRDYREQLIQKMNAVAQPTQAPLLAQGSISAPIIQSTATPTWFFMGGTQHASAAPQPTTSSQDDNLLTTQILQKNSSRNASYGNLRTLKTIPQTQQLANPSASLDQQLKTQSATEMTTPSHPVILALANNDDLSVSTIAREAKKVKGIKQSKDEVVISLH